MDFIILKVNGQDLTAASHEQVLQVLNTASEPIFVEVARRYSRPSPPVSTLQQPQMADLAVSIPYPTTEHTVPYGAPIGVPAVPPDYPSPQWPSSQCCHDANHCLSASANGKPHQPGPADSTPRSRDPNPFGCGPGVDNLNIDGILEEDEEFEFDDEEEEQVEIIKEEVVLRKKHPREIFGLTLSYSALSASDNSESEVYISAIEPNSIAKKEPNIRLGDQILQINNVDVHSKSQVVSLFQNCGLEARLLLGRPNIIPKNGGHPSKNGMYNSEQLPTLEEVEYASVYDEVESNMNKDKKLGLLDKDSGICRGPDEAAKTEDSSECDSNQMSMKHSNSRPDPAQIAQLMQHLALEYQQLQRLLHGSIDPSIPRIQAQAPLSFFQSSSRLVPRMGTKLDSPQIKSVNTPPTASGSNTSAYSTGADSTRSSPLTMEVGQNFKSSSFLSLKIDVRNNNSKFMDDNFNVPQCRSKNPGNPEQRVCNSFFANLNDTSQMTSSTILNQCGFGAPGITHYLSDETERHYYDVYDPLTKSMSEVSKPTSRSSSQNEQSNGSEDHEYINAQLIKFNKLDNKMEWVVKKRPDGTRYITRRPVRNKVLKEREKKLNEERNYTTEEEDFHGDILSNRCLGKSADKKRYYDKPKDKKCKRKTNPNGIQQSDLFSNGSVVDFYAFHRSAMRDDIQNRSFGSRNSDLATFFVGSTMF